MQHRQASQSVNCVKQEPFQPCWLLQMPAFVLCVHQDTTQAQQDNHTANLVCLATTAIPLVPTQVQPASNVLKDSMLQHMPPQCVVHVLQDHTPTYQDQHQTQLAWHACQACIQMCLVRLHVSIVVWEHIPIYLHPQHAFNACLAHIPMQQLQIPVHTAWNVHRGNIATLQAHQLAQTVLQGHTLPQ